jgi:hypothetical protein
MCQCREVNILVTHAEVPRFEYLVHLTTLSVALGLYGPNNWTKIKVIGKNLKNCHGLIGCKPNIPEIIGKDKVKPRNLRSEWSVL